MRASSLKMRIHFLQRALSPASWAAAKQQLTPTTQAPPPVCFRCLKMNALWWRLVSKTRLSVADVSPFLNPGTRPYGCCLDKNWVSTPHPSGWEHDSCSVAFLWVFLQRFFHLQPGLKPLVTDVNSAWFVCLGEPKSNHLVLLFLLCGIEFLISL